MGIDIVGILWYNADDFAVGIRACTFIVQRSNNTMKKLIGNCYVDYDSKNILWALGFENEYEKELIVPNGVYVIGYQAFEKYYCLESIQLPETLKIIGADAFCKCSSLRKVSLPSSVTEIKRGAFADCLQLVEVDLSNTKLEILPKSLFANCKKLQRVILPKTLKKIEEDCFYGCNKLTSIEFNEGLMIIENNFAYMEGLSIINLPDSVVHIEDMSSFHYDHIKTIILSAKQKEMFEPYLPEDCQIIVR